LTLGDFSLLEENKPQSPTLAEYAAQWLRTYAAVHCKPATVFNYERDYHLHVAPMTDTLKALLVERKKDTLLNGWGEVPLLVFVSERGTILDGDHIRGRAFRTVLKKAGLRHIRIHDLRHTFASLLIQMGSFSPT
jgi:integrase